MNNITRLQASIVAKDAEIRALRDGLLEIRAYALSSKFTHPETGNNGYVNAADIALRAEQASSVAYDAGHAAYVNEIGPEIADGSHHGCTHGTFPRVAQFNGYHCRQCGEGLPGEWNDTESKAQERMRQHWVARHKDVA